MRTVSIPIFVLALAIPSLACAQVRAGLSLDALRSGLDAGGLAVGEVVVADDDAAPVRVALVRAEAAIALLDVRVLANHDEASAWIADRAATISTSGTTARARDLYADTEQGRAGVVLAARANVAIAVRAIDPGIDAMALAAIALAAIDAAPASAAPIAVSAPRTDELAPEASMAVQVPDAIAVRVVATGGGYARRTPRGWMITRTGPEPIAARVIAVDRYLRVAR